MRRATWKRRVQNILSNCPGFYQDEFWEPVQGIFRDLKSLGCDAYTQEARYISNEDGVATGKVWYICIDIEGYHFDAIITAHGAGSVSDPLGRYDISAYITK